MKTYWRSGGIAPCILNLGTRCRWMVSFTAWPLYIEGKGPPSTTWVRGWAWWKREKNPIISLTRN